MKAAISSSLCTAAPGRYSPPRYRSARCGAAERLVRWAAELWSTRRSIVRTASPNTASPPPPVRTAEASWFISSLLRDEIERHADYGTVVITNLGATAKFVESLPIPYLSVRRSLVSEKQVEYLANRHERVAIILLDRTDSEYWREDARANEAFVRSLRRPMILEVDRRITATDRLRIWRVAGGRAS